MQNEEFQISKPKVGVAVLSYNGKELLEKFLPPIINTDYNDFEVYVIDNASTDGTGDFLKENFPEVKVISIEINKGFTNGYVEGLKHIDNEYYVLVSSDIEVTEGWMRPIIDLMESDQSIAACQPKVKSYDLKDHFEYSGSAGGYIDILGYPFCRGRMFNNLEIDSGQYDDTREVFWATGGCLFIRSELYNKAGGLDDDFYAHMEEIDLCWRLKNMGYKIYVCPKSVVYHVGGHIISYGSPTKIYRNFRNSLITDVKNIPTNQLIWKLPLRILLDILFAYKSLFTGNFTEYKSIAKAHFNFFTNMGKWFTKRKEAKKLWGTPNNTGMYNGSVIVDFFLKGKKKFSDLNIS